MVVCMLSGATQRFRGKGSRCAVHLQAGMVCWHVCVLRQSQEYGAIVTE